jgi:hypothetical protein
VKTQKEETVLLRKALQDCEACKVTAKQISKPYQQVKPNNGRLPIEQMSKSRS